MTISIFILLEKKLSKRGRNASKDALYEVHQRTPYCAVYPMLRRIGKDATKHERVKG